MIRKAESESIKPLRPLFPPIVEPELWRRVHDKLQGRSRTNPQFGKSRTRSRATHPLNGKLFCPDCDKPMVLGSSMPAVGQGGKKTRCFNCGTYRRCSRRKCYANTVGWDRLDSAIEQLLETVKGRINRLIADPQKALGEELWAKECELTRIMCAIGDEVDADMLTRKDCADIPSDPSKPIFEAIVEEYNRIYAGRTIALREELERIERELKRLGDVLVEGIPSQTVKKHLFARMAELEARKKAIEPELIPLTARADVILEQLRSIRRVIGEIHSTAVAGLLDTFIEKVIPRFDIEHIGPKKQRRAILRTVEFIPKKTSEANNILPQAMEVCGAHTGRGSSRPRAQSRRGTWLGASPG